jgi:WhiB family redox-sensing transcriptional regulator
VGLAGGDLVTAVASEGVLSRSAARNLRREQRMTALLRECEGVVVRDWRQSAACVDSSPDLFALVDSASGTPAGEVHEVNLVRHEEAAKVCRRCPVRLACLADALERGGKGTWGGELLRDEDHLAARRVLKKMWEETL